MEDMHGQAGPWASEPQEDFMAGIEEMFAKANQHFRDVEAAHEPTPALNDEPVNPGEEARDDGPAGDIEPQPPEEAHESERTATDRVEVVPARNWRSATGDSTPRVWRASELRPAERPRWLAKNRLPSGAVSLLVGDEGIGKSLMWVWVAAPVTRGRALPEFGIPARPPGHVVIVATEDDWSMTVRPRLEVAGADLAMIQVICTEDDGSGAPVFPRDLHLIAECDPAPALVVVDAWLDTVPPNLSVKDPQQARQALHPWREIATATDAAVLLLTHTNRVASGNARDRYGATGELRKMARMTLFAQRVDGTLVIGPEKSNGAVPVPATTFTIKPKPYFQPSDDHDGTVPVLSYVGESAQTAQEYIAEGYASGRQGGGGNDDVVAWVATYLADGPKWSVNLFKDAQAAGWGQDKIKRAKKRLGAESEKDGTTGSWFFRLPGQDGRPGPGQECMDDTD